MSIKVLFIGGWGRSGTTLFEQLLGQAEGYFAAGELHNMWHRNIEENRLCGCGLPFSECQVWQQILQPLRDSDGGQDLAEIGRRIRLASRDWSGVRSLTHRGRKKMENEFSDSLRTLSDLYASISGVSGARVIIDSSKVPGYGVLLSLIEDIDLYVLHLVRDPRGVAYSWQKSKLQESDLLMKRRSVFDSSWKWGVRNLETETILRHQVSHRYMRLRYEDMVTDPAAFFRSVQSFLNEPADALWDDPSHIDVSRPLHTTFGNIVRFNSGEIALRLDDEWRRRMPATQRIVVSAVTFPWILRYGYS